VVRWTAQPLNAEKPTMTIVMAPEGPRYAVYFTPEAASSLARFGSSIIGYDANCGVELPFLVPEGYDRASWAGVIAEPRRYGFHATLKAPFHLRLGRTEAELLAAASEFARRHTVVVLEALAVRTLGSFIALIIDTDAADVSTLAAAAVRELEPLRAPLSPTDFERRRAAPLTDRQVRHLEQYGYPYVFDDFRFHMTLTGAVMIEQRSRLRDWLAQEFSARVPREPIALDALTILRQETRTGRFRTIARFPLQGPRPNRAAPT
jgi:putative phosphonate metabolism protein